MRRILDNNTMENGYFSDNCKLDEKLRYNGLYTDLCGMSVEDYIKAGKFPCCDGSQDGGNNDEEVIPTKVINLLTFSTNSNGLLTAYLNYAPTTTINVSCNCEGTNVVFTLTDGNIQVSNVMPTNDVLSVTDVTFEPTEDDKYKYGDYTVVSDSNKFVYTTKTIPNFKELDTIGNLSVDDLNEQVIENDGTTIVFNRPVSELPEDYNDPDFDYDNWVANNSYVEVFILNKNDFDNGEVKVLNGNDEISKYLHEIETITVNNEIYSVLVRIADNNTQNSLNYNGLDVITYSADTEMNSNYVIKKKLN